MVDSQLASQLITYEQAHIPSDTHSAKMLCLLANLFKQAMRSEFPYWLCDPLPLQLKF